MTLEKDDKGKNVIDGGRLLALYRPAVKQLADLHHSGRIHGSISPEVMNVHSRIRFCFPLTTEAAKGYDIDGKLFVQLRLSNKNESNGQHKAVGSQQCDRGEGGRTVRKAPYIPLEQMIDEENTDARSDVYSLCAVLYQFITGIEPPNVRERIGGAELKKPSELGVEISPDQETALLKGLEEIGKYRYSNGAELYQALYGIDYEKENSENGKTKTNRKKNFLRNGWTVKADVKEIKKLRSVTFLDHIPRTKEKKWDVSQKTNGSVLAWLKEAGEEYDMYIGSNGEIVAGKDCSWMFNGCINLKTIDFGGNFDTRYTANMAGMFCKCSALEALDVSGFNTSKVTNMSLMFYNCCNLNKLDVSSFDTSRVTDMSCMFYNCRSLSKLDVSNFDTSRVEKQHLMFYNCTSLKKVLG